MYKRQAAVPVESESANENVNDCDEDVNAAALAGVESVTTGAEVSVLVVVTVELNASDESPKPNKMGEEVTAAVAFNV